MDAGYLFAEGAANLTNDRLGRTDVELRLSATMEKLATLATAKSGGARLLRICWYDGLVRGRLSKEQSELAHTDNVKVRLGLVSGGRQKGVDSLIVTDLIELSRNRAISDAVVVSGDEDIRIGVQVAQSFGVRIQLVGFRSTNKNQSTLLVQEADTTTEWDVDDVRQILAIKARAALNADRSSSPGTHDERREAGVADVHQRVVAQVVGSMDDESVTRVNEALAQNPPTVPYDLDVRLLIGVRQAIERDLDESERIDLRARFRRAIEARRQSD